MTVTISKEEALAYHEAPTPGKLAIHVTKATDNQKDLSLAYSPGVAEPVLAISESANNAYRYTSKGNLVGILTNGSAILGLGNLGALASKPVMEGKAVLFKQFANIDAFDIEIEAQDVETFIETAANIAPTFGAINLEDIKAPDCFAIEEALQQRLNIPVIHDDQHGTAIVLSAGLLNALELQHKKLSEAKIVMVGAGAAAIACAKLLIKIGANPKQLLLLDRQGVIHDQRTDLNPYKQALAVATNARTLADAVQDADVLIGLAGAAMPEPEALLKAMRPNPITFLLSNPTPGIPVDMVQTIRPDAIIATGRSDLPNQINNALCFPYLFRGTLDARASRINHAMQCAAVEALRQLAKEPIPQAILDAYHMPTDMTFGQYYILPTPTDHRLNGIVSGAVYQAAIDSGVSNL